MPDLEARQISLLSLLLYRDDNERRQEISARPLTHLLDNHIHIPLGLDDSLQPSNNSRHPLLDISELFHPYNNVNFSTELLRYLRRPFTDFSLPLLNMAYNNAVEEFRDDEYPMMKGKKSQWPKDIKANDVG